MKKTKYLIPLLALLGILVLFQLLRENKTTNKEALINSLLARDSRFQSLSVETMKPGWYRISGKVALTNDLVDLKQVLNSNGVTQCAILVEVN